MILAQRSNLRIIAAILVASPQILSAFHCAALGQKPNPDPVETAIRLQKMKRFDEALGELNKAINQGDRRWSTYYQRAITYKSLRQDYKALSDLDEAIKLDPKRIEPLLLHALINRIETEDDQAIAYYTRGLAIEADNPECLWERSAAYGDTMQYDLAIKDIRHYLAGHPERSGALVMRQMGTFYLLSNQPAQAVECLTKAISVCPQQAKSHEFRANAYLLLKDYKAAIADYTVELKSVPSPLMYISRAQAYKNTGQAALAAQDEKSAKEIGGAAFEDAPFRTKKSGH